MYIWLVFLLVSGLLPNQCRSGDDPDPETGSEDSDLVDPKRSTLSCGCAPYYQCSKDNVVVPDGAGLLDARRKTRPDEDIALDEKYRPPWCNPPNLVCCKSPGTLTEQSYTQSCGIRRPNGVDSRILSRGQDGSTEFGEFPWQGAVLTDRNGQALFKCACVLINAEYALTVAHCVDEYKLSPKKIFTRFGVWDTRSEAELLPYQTGQISDISVHPDYNKDNLRNDIAVLKIQPPLNYRPNVDTICLPKQTENHNGEKCIVTGWGKNSWEGGAYSPQLKKVSVPIHNNTFCQKKLRGTRLGQFYELHKSFICAGGIKGQDSCKGDGGGPLACYRKDGVYTLMGLVSWGIGCGSEVPAVYVRITEFLDWISRVTLLPIEKFWPDS